MNTSYHMEPCLFGVSADHVREALDRSGFCRDLSVSVTGSHMLVSVSLSAEGEDSEARCRGVVAFLKGTYGTRLFTEDGGTLWETTVSVFREKKETLALAESCTGGLVSKAITDVPGASEVFPMGAVTYSPASKQQLLRVKEETLRDYGVVSKETAAEMAEGVRELSGATVGLGVTGFAGPGGGDDRWPQGTVFVSLSDGKTVYLRHLSMTHSQRSDVRLSAMLHGLDMLRLYAQGHLDDIGDPMAVPTLAGTTAKKKDKKAKLPWYKRLLHFFTDFPRDPIKEKIRKIILVLAVGVMLFAAYKLGTGLYQFIANSIYESRIQGLVDKGNNLSEAERQEYIDKLKQQGVDVPENISNWALPLLAQNPDTVGRVRISTADDPDYLNQIVVQGVDNEEYLHKSFFGDYNTLGCVYMDYRCNANASSTNTILHGHATRNANKVFNKLHKYKELDFLNANPIVHFDTLTDTYDYKIFAVMIINATAADGEVYTGAYYANAAIMNELDNIRARSLFDTTVDVQSGDHLLTLSTCTFEANDLRLVVMARRVREGESLAVSAASVNSDVLQYDRNNPDPTPDNSSSGDSSDTSADVSSSDQQGNRFEIYDMALSCKVSTSEQTTSIKAYVPYYTDFEQECTIGIGENPDHGRVSLVSSDGTVNYYPNKNFSGVDTFTVILTDSSGLRRDTATVTVYVGVTQETGVTLTSTTLYLTAKAGKTGTAQVKAKSVSGQALFYEVLPHDGLFSGTAVVDENGLVTYTSLESERYADTVKVIVRDEDNVAKLVWVKVNNDCSFQNNANPVISELVSSKPPVSSEISSQVSSEISSDTSDTMTSDDTSHMTTSEDVSSEDASSEATSSEDVPSEATSPEETSSETEAPPVSDAPSP